MKMAEYVKGIKDASGVYDRPSGLRNLYWDLVDALDEGYIEGVTIVAKTRDGNIKSIEGIRARCEDGIVWVKKGDEDGLSFREIADYSEKPAPSHTPRRMGMSPYERTRAAVYARGNKWQIENFNATH